MAMSEQVAVQVVWITKAPPGQPPCQRIAEDPLPERDELLRYANALAAHWGSQDVRSTSTNSGKQMPDTAGDDGQSQQQLPSSAASFQLRCALDLLPQVMISESL